MEILEGLKWGATNRDQVPEWAYDKEVVELAYNIRRRSSGNWTVPLGCVCGPAVVWAKLGVFIVVLCWLVAPILAYYNTDCAEYDGLQPCNNIPLYFTLFFVFIPIELYCQFKCFRQVVIHQLTFVDQPQFLGFKFKKYPFWIFFLLISSLSCLNLLTTLTNGEVLGRLMATEAFCENQKYKLEAYFHKSIARSWVSFLGINCDFWFIACFVYALQLSMPLSALLYATPLRFCQEYLCCNKYPKISYKVQFNDSYTKDIALDDIRGIEEYYTIYHYNKKTNHGQVTMFLATLAGMGAVTHLDNAYTFGRLRESKYKISTKARWRKNYLHAALDPLHHQMVHFLFVGLLRNAFQINVQISLAGINLALDPQLVFSIVVTLLSIIVETPYMCGTLRAVVTNYTWYTKSVDLGAGSAQHRIDAEPLKQHIFKDMIYFGVGMLFYVLLIFWSIEKIVALAVCKSHMMDNFVGCI